MSVSLIGCLLLLNIFLSPHLSVFFSNANDIGYMSCILTSTGAYSTKLLAALFFAYGYIVYVQGNLNKKRFLTVFILNVVLSFVLGISSGVYLFFTIYVPAFLCLLVEALLQNKLSVFINKRSLLVYACSIACFIGKSVALNMFHFASRDSIQIWCALDMYRILLLIFC